MAEAEVGVGTVWADDLEEFVPSWDELANMSQNCAAVLVDLEAEGTNELGINYFVKRLVEPNLFDDDTTGSCGGQFGLLSWLLVVDEVGVVDADLEGVVTLQVGFAEGVIYAEACLGHVGAENLDELTLDGVRIEVADGGDELSDGEVPVGPVAREKSVQVLLERLVELDVVYDDRGGHGSLSLIVGFETA